MNVERPNIILVECDSMDGRAMGHMGCLPLSGATPNMDRMAAEGAAFPNTYCANPICVCSRASMWSGLYTFHCHGWSNDKGLPSNSTTFLTQLQELGYQTAVYGKTDYICGQHSMRAQVSAWTRSACIRRPQYKQEYPEILDSDERCVHRKDWDTVNRGTEFLRRMQSQPQQEPFFLYVGVNAPHPHYITSRRYLERIGRSSIEIPPKDLRQHPVMELMRLQKNWTHGFDEETVRLVRAVYYAMIAETDEMLGEILNAAADLENTYILFLSDHGEMNMEHEQYYKMTAYEPSVRVPLLAMGPGIVPGRKSEHLTSLVDIYPTLLEMAGGKAGKKRLDGGSLLPVMKGMEDKRENIAFSEFHDSPACTGIFMLRKDEYKYIAYPGYEPMLFNLREDPWEICNLAPQMSGKVKEMDVRLRKIVDYPTFDFYVKENDKDCFRTWRREQVSHGTYRENMARIFSGGEHLEEGDIRPWTDEEEAELNRWMEDGSWLDA